MKKAILIICFIGSLYSCNKILDYFREPDVEILEETLRSTRLTGYAATLAMSAINGHSSPDVHISRSNGGFPCSAVISIDPGDFGIENAEHITIAGLWADGNTAVLSLILSNYSYQSNVFELVGIETIPVLMEGNNIHVALASQEIILNPDQDALLSVDLDNFQFESELIRLDMPRPGDIYLAVNQSAYFIDVDTKGTFNNIDDNYMITGGGQLIEVENNSAEIVQQAVIEVMISSGCERNPMSGMALIRTTGVEDENFPELGTLLIEFINSCQGKAGVFAATGIYISSNGKKIPFEL